jgi:ubiquinone/menaquinone biosynthesis C-methylase UbiE
MKSQVREFWNSKPCGMGFSTHTAGSKAFFEEVERHRYAQEYHIPKIANFRVWKDKRVLEIGCGLGTDLLQFARSGAQVVGIDITETAVHLTRELFRYYNLDGRIEVGDAESLQFPEGSFDLVYSHGVLHHTPDTEKAIAEIYRVLKPGGRAIVMLYHKHSYNYWVNIRIIRNIAFTVIRYGFPITVLRTFAGTKSELLKEYERVIKGVTTWTEQDLLNNNTDGPGNPISKVFTRWEAKNMFGRFSAVETKVHWLVKKNIPLIGRCIPRPIDYLLGRLMGWALYVFAVK